MLEQLDGTAGPRLRRRGTIGESPYLVLDWCAGSAADIAAAEYRALPSDERRAALLSLAIAVLDVYARLHARGVVHGDIHPRNILVDRDNRVSLLDFALARQIGTDSTGVPRAGVPFYYEPELARALLDGLTPPPASEAGEQFALAALLYLLFTGEHYQDFQLEQHAFLSAIRDGSVLSFAARGIEPWPEAEAVLARALSKAPAERWPSISVFADSLRHLQTVAANGRAGASHAGRAGLSAASAIRARRRGAHVTRHIPHARGIRARRCVRRRTAGHAARTDGIGHARRRRSRLWALPSRARPRGCRDACAGGPVGIARGGGCGRAGCVCRRGARAHCCGLLRQHPVSHGRGRPLRPVLDRQCRGGSAVAGRIRGGVHPRITRSGARREPRHDAWPPGRGDRERAAARCVGTGARVLAAAPGRAWHGRDGGDRGRRHVAAGDA